MFDTLKKVAVVALLGVAASGAQAASVTFNSAGVLASGYDGLNVFGLGTDLAGKSFTQSITVELDNLVIDPPGPGYEGRDGWGNVETTVAVDGVSYSWKSQAGRGTMYMMNTLTQGAADGSDSAWLSASADLSPSWRVSGSTGIWSQQTPFMSSSALLAAQQFNQLAGVSAESDFEMWQLDSAGYYTGYKGIVSSASWTYDATVSPVPEPGTVAMFMLGVGLVGVAARKRKAARGL